MKKISTAQTRGRNIFQGQLTIGVDLGDRCSAYCVLNESGEIVLEHKLATTPEAMKQVFESMPRCRVAMSRGRILRG
jgi:transposase